VSRPQRIHLLGVLLVVVQLCVTSSEVEAQEGFDAQRFHPQPSRSTGFLQVRSARTVGRHAFNLGLWVDAFDDPLVIGNAQGQRLASVVDRRVDGHLLGAFGFTDWLELGLDVPLVLYQSGDEVPGADLPGDDAAAGLANIRLVPRVEIISQDEDNLGLGIGAYLDLSLPTGSKSDFRSDGFRLEPGVAVEYAFSRVRAAVNGGYTVRPPADFGLLQHNDAITVGVAAEARIIGGLSVMPEFNWERGITAPSNREDYFTRELLGALRYLADERVLFELGGGGGLPDARGAARFRLFAGITFVGGPSNAAAVRDGDGDGVADKDDACPKDAEDRDGVKDEDGCPDLDRDGDGVDDATDKCPDEAEDVDGVNDEDGCVDADAVDEDEDGVLDANDGCPDEAEDKDGHGDADGCPDLDNDEDGVPDTRDGPRDASGLGSCRDQAENRNGVTDDDGCPDADAPPPAAVAEPEPEPAPVAAAAPATESCQPVDLSQRVRFETGTTLITAESRAALSELARTLRTSPQVKRVRIEGHADNTGEEAFNNALSLRRALAVRDALLRARLPQKLEVEGFGEARPIADNETEEGRAQNRRSEVVITQQVGCP